MAPVVEKLPQEKVICTAWIGRFGNRCHSYLFGKHVEDTFGCKFYVPSKWEGSGLFRNPAPIVPDAFRQIRPVANDDTSKFKKTFARNSEAVAQYNRDTGDHVEFIDANKEEHYGKLNIAFSSLVTDADWFFKKITRLQLREYFAFSDELKESAVFRELEAAKGTYDVAHFRRTDIAAARYQGGHSMISRRSYLAAFEEFGSDPTHVVWISDEADVGWKWKGNCPIIGGCKLPWLPDFLRLVFARRLYRSNSAFSTWAGWLGEAEVISPWLPAYSPGKELDVKFVKGNHPHWMAVKGAHSCYQFQLKGERCPPPPSKIEIDGLRFRKAATDLSAELGRRKRIMMIHWNGRFGNRMFSFSFGRHYAAAFDHDFYIPSAWEGSILFRHQGCKIIEDDELRLRLNQTAKPFDNLAYRRQAIDHYCERTHREFTFINPDNFADYGKSNVCYDSLCVNNRHIFDRYSRKTMLEWFAWSDAVKSLDIYKSLEDIQGTYDIAHLRRDDISSPAYNRVNHQAYSVISKDSYLQAFKRFGFNPERIEWSTDDCSGKWIKRQKGNPSGGWTYPFGSHRIPNVIFDWLPDFLRLYFARSLFRSNSSFSWWAGFLSPCAKVYSPVLTQRKIYLSENDEISCEFEEGNHPHWMNLSTGNSCREIHIPA